MTFPAGDLVHPLETAARSACDPGSTIDGRLLDRYDVQVIVDRICAVLGLRRPLVYVSERPGHAHAPGAVRIAERSVVDLSQDELEALLAHACGHLVLPLHAGELSADRVAALYHGHPDAITRVIFAEAVHSGPAADHTVRVREIQAWTATPGFARLASLVRFAT